jgi:hypothetical protein
MSILAAGAGAGNAGVRALFVLAGLIAVWLVLDYFFGREIGGNRAKGGGQGGAEKNIVGVSIFLAAVAVGIMIATRDH